MRILIVIVGVIVLSGCETVDKAATISAEGINRYCGLTPSARQTIADEVIPKLDEGVCVDIDCPGDASDSQCAE